MSQGRKPRKPASKGGKRKPTSPTPTGTVRNEPRTDSRRDQGKQHASPQASKVAPPAGKERERETHWIDFASKEQKDAIHAELNTLCAGDDAWQVVVVKTDSNVFTYRKGDFWSVHLLPREAKDRFKPLMGNPGLKHFGLFLGLLKQEGTPRAAPKTPVDDEGEAGQKLQFNISLEGATELARYCAPASWVKVNEEGEKSFLYGQDVKKAHVASIVKGGIPHPRGICLVLNEGGECIGIGRLEGNDPTLASGDPETVVVKNQIDKGAYLRAQGSF